MKSLSYQARTTLMLRQKILKPYAKNSEYEDKATLS
jgi:hypothetical protein